MNVNKPASRRSLTSNLKQVDGHNIAPHEYEELWAAAHGVLKQVNAYLLSLPESEWHHLGE